MLSVRVMLLGVILIMTSSLDFHGFGSLSVVARSIEKRAIPQLMDYDQSSYQQEQPPQREHRTHIVKIHSRKNQRSNDPVLGDVTNFQGIGEDHNAFGGPKYAGQYYPLMTGDLNLLSILLLELSFSFFLTNSFYHTHSCSE